MTQTIPDADIRGYYHGIGVTLPAWATDNANVRCFADPDAHRHGDHHASCSVNLATGAFNCHGCGAHGGAYDAAIELGRDPHAAIDLMISHGLTQRRFAASRQHPARDGDDIGPGASQPVRAVARFTVTETDITRWHNVLDPDSPILERLAHERGWQLDTMRELGLGVDHGRITIPVRDPRRRLVGLLRYQPWAGHGQAKMRAAVGSRRQLLPHPALEQSDTVWLVEGEPDMITARSHGLHAIAVPGTESWKSEWAAALAGRDVTVLLDCDRQGRAAALRIAEDVGAVAHTRVLDLAPHRDDGFDLTDWLQTGAPGDLQQLR